MRSVNFALKYWIYQAWNICRLHLVPLYLTNVRNMHGQCNLLEVFPWLCMYGRLLIQYMGLISLLNKMWYYIWCHIIRPIICCTSNEQSSSSGYRAVKHIFQLPLTMSSFHGAKKKTRLDMYKINLILTTMGKNLNIDRIQDSTSIRLRRSAHSAR